MPVVSSSARPFTRGFPANAESVAQHSGQQLPQPVQQFVDRKAVQVARCTGIVGCRPSQRPYASGEARVGN
ncbi:hypothetical protein [Streptomyces sp. NBC_00268]|uniref:hypothetical protein n=1 Tax=Streptomyces sp. NBC_00268 TaxID=2975695 RepID=UPI00224FF6FB|nr:hypothetical protein [Streptomyces sp. NBC_00268]MCX5183118.1 hypothetical protein [Streptomyces sp. NBC_00268]